ncbi:MAG: FAD-dependent oxidoreductase [Oscillospiraceae bacterium]|nr:FAD-dependent oxidoreductase [Oscillospiraceae bacterium]
MGEIKLTINGIECAGTAGQTILETARANGIDIPTLCHDERAEIYGSCGICVVEAEGNPRLLRACSIMAADGMVIHTDTERVRKSRQTMLELLLSDHTGDCVAPCVLHCPGETDCQGYVKLTAEGKYNEAYNLIMEKLPFPASIGRVCPHPCEEACRRELVEEPVSIMELKRYVGDKAILPQPPAATAPSEREPKALLLEEGGTRLAYAGRKCREESGKSVAIVGGGPGGLTAAYFLRLKGHAVTVYDAMPQMGGMLRYGIPEYRLPKEILQKEIDVIAKTGVEMRNNVKIGRNITLSNLKKDYDAVIVAVGAWTSVGLGCPGEELDGVVGGIDFLRGVSPQTMSGSDNRNEDVLYPLSGQKVAVVGGGNTAMDACRTAVRLGADAVYNIYRRTKNEMPAEEIEITEAEEEGVVFKNLTNPIEIIGKDGKVCAVRLQIMELGQPDASGRRRPVAVQGKEETLDVESVLVAIGQKTDVSGLEELELTRWKTLAADEHTFRTNLEGVFAVGDATNNGAGIAISAIGEARRAAGMVDRYLNGETLEYKAPYLVKTEKTAKDFEDRKKELRVKVRCRPAGERIKDFKEINPGLTEEEARKEASRCLECGCLDYFECKLIKYANQYDVQPEKYGGKMHRRAVEDDIPGVVRTPDKCILCGLCVRLCEEEVGAGVLGFVGRGFDTVVMPAGDCIECVNCGKCAEVCPTGALIGKVTV